MRSNTVCRHTQVWPDRLIMIMAGMDSIRDVIAFPKVKDASCLMTDAPNVVDDIQLKELGIDIAEEEKAGDAEA